MDPKRTSWRIDAVHRIRSVHVGIKNRLKSYGWFTRTEKENLGPLNRVYTTTEVSGFEVKRFFVEIERVNVTGR